MSDRIEAAKKAYLKNKESWAEDLESSGIPAARVIDIDKAAQRKKPTPEEVSPEELEVHAETVAEILIEKTRRDAQRYMRDRGFTAEQQSTILRAASKVIQDSASFGEEVSKELSIARHERIAEKAMAMPVPELKTALEAQRSIDLMVGVTESSDEVSDIRDGFIAAMKDVFNSDPAQSGH